MAKIKPLPHGEIVKIAAGEVIGRPANAVKELVENSIDAGANKITVTIEQAGRGLIQVTDNGCGMSEDDASNSIGLHWTSKIKTFDDLSDCFTFGFRGEALASIAAIGRLEITTTEVSADHGSRVLVEYGKVLEVGHTSPVPGTTMRVTNFFENVPARKKFLASDLTEYNAIVNVMQGLALGHSEIGFCLISEGRVAYNWPGCASVVERIGQVLKTEVSEKLLVAECPLVKIWVGQPSLNRPNKSQIWLFVNGRMIKDQKLSSILISAYGSSLGKDRYPVAFVYIKTDPSSFDVNVHPRKEEVKFVDPSSIGGKIYNCVKRALAGLIETKEHLIPVITATPEIVSEVGGILEAKVSVLPKVDFEELPKMAPIEPKEAVKKAGNFEQAFAESRFDAYIQPSLKLPPEKDLNYSQQSFVQGSTRQFLGQLFQTFLLFQESDSLLIVDQHAAHERILYNNQLGKKLPATRLLIPELCNVGPTEEEFILEYRQVLLHFGFDVDHFGPGQICIRATPNNISGALACQMVQSIFGSLESHFHDGKSDLAERIGRELFAQICCKAAIKAGQTLSESEANKLVTDLFLTQENFQCIHGRPTFWRISQAEVVKQFRRPAKVF